MMEDIMTHEEKVIIYTLGLLEDAREHGLKGGNFRLDVAGVAAYKKMRTEKFRPSDKELEIAFTLLNSPPDEVRQVYRMHGKIKFEWQSSPKWLWIMITRLFKKK